MHRCACGAGRRQGWRWARQGIRWYPRSKASNARRALKSGNTFVDEDSCSVSIAQRLKRPSRRIAARTCLSDIDAEATRAPISWPEHRNGVAARRSCYDQETGPRECRSTQQTPKQYPRECYDRVIQTPGLNADRNAIRAIQRPEHQLHNGISNARARRR